MYPIINRMEIILNQGHKKFDDFDFMDRKKSLKSILGIFSVSFWGKNKK